MCRPTAGILCGRPPSYIYIAKRHFLEILTYSKLDLWPFELKIGTMITPALWNVYANFVFFSAPFCFRAGVGQTDERTDGRARPILRPIGTTV